MGKLYKASADIDFDWIYRHVIITASFLHTFANVLFTTSDGLGIRYVFFDKYFATRPTPDGKAYRIKHGFIRVQQFELFAAFESNIGLN